jgi:hypothetical protein
MPGGRIEMAEHINLKGDHVVNLRISWDLKSRLVALAQAEHRSLSDICRILLLTGLPILEGMDRAYTRAIGFRLADRRDDTVVLEET